MPADWMTRLGALAAETGFGPAAILAMEWCEVDWWLACIAAYREEVRRAGE